MLAPTLNCVLVKPAGPLCNLRCSYCFYCDKEELFEGEYTKRMTGQLQEMLIRNALEKTPPSLGTFSFIWQGGEPTLMGLPFYERAVRLQKKHAKNCDVSNILQTNGMLMDDAWCDFLQRENFLVGISLDGKAHVHDTYRHGKMGGQKSTTHAQVERAAKSLLAAKVECNALACVTSYSAPYLVESYEYLRDLGFTYMQFIPVVEKDAQGNIADFSVSPEAYGQALCKLFDAWKADFANGKPTTSIRLFETTFFTLLGTVSPECGSRKTCGTYVTVEHNGEVYPCDFFVEKAHLLGNIREHNLQDLLQSQKQRVFGNAKARVHDACLKCPWLSLCGGGCLKDRRINPEGFGRTYFCKALQKFYAHAVPTLKSLAQKWQG